MPLQISEVAPDPVLTNLVIAKGTGGGFIQDDIFPPVPVNRDEGKYTVYKREEIKQDVETLRAIAAEANEVNFTLNYETYAADEHALVSKIGDRIMNNSPNPEALRRRRSLILNNRLRLGIETRIAALVNDDTVIANAVPAIKWDAANPTIEADIDAAKEAFVLASGFEANRIIFPPTVSKVVKRDPTIRELIKYTQNDLLVNGDLPPTVFNMKVLIPGALEDVSSPGAAENIARVWNLDNALLAYVDPSVEDTETLTAGIQLRPKTLAGGMNLIAKTWREQKVDAEWFQVQRMNTEKVVAKSALYIIKDVLT